MTAALRIPLWLARRFKAGESAERRPFSGQYAELVGIAGKGFAGAAMFRRSHLETC